MLLGLLISGFIGQALAAISLINSVSSYPLYLIGETLAKYRLLLTYYSLIGTDVMTVISTYEAVWFKNKETSLAMALDNAFETLGIVVMFFVQPGIFQQSKSLFVCFGMVSILYAFSLACCLLLIYIDKYAPNNDEGENIESFKNFSWKMFGQLGPAFWMLAIGHAFVSGTLGAFGYVVSGFFQKRFNWDDQMSGYIAGTSPLVMVLAAAPAGFLISKYGCKVHVSNISISSSK